MKIQTILAALCLIMFLSSCNHATQVSETKEESQKSGSVNNKNENQDNITLNKNSNYPDESYNSDNIDSLGLELMSVSHINGIKIGMYPDQVTSILGEPESKSESFEWASDDGFHEFWYYCDSSLVLEFVNYSTNEEKAVEVIELNDSCSYTTDRGITIGSDLDIVKSRYAKAIKISDWQEGQSQILLGDAGAGGLFFTICEERVCNIRIGIILRC